MKGLIQVEFRPLDFSNTPVVQRSNTPIALVIFTGKSIQT